MKKITVAVVFGGASTEYEVSLESATSVLRNISHETFDVIMLGITKEGRWLRYTGPVDRIAKNEWQQPQYVTQAFLSPDRSVHGIVEIRDGNATVVPVDVVFPVLHGKTGRTAPSRACWNWPASPMWAAMSVPAPSAWTKR